MIVLQLALFCVLFTLMVKVGAFWLGFTNGLMSESMIIWFGIMLIRDIMEKRNKERCISIKWNSRCERRTKNGKEGF